jgi:hypothetical protein
LEQVRQKGNRLAACDDPFEFLNRVLVAVKTAGIQLELPLSAGFAEALFENLKSG